MGLWRVLVALAVVPYAGIGSCGRLDGTRFSSSSSKSKLIPSSSSRFSSSSSSPPVYNPSVECKAIRLTSPDQASVVTSSVLRQMCLAAAPHVDVDKIFKQFAIFLLQRDDFDETPKWYSGDAKNVLADQYWAVNDVTVLETTKYKWYVHGLPMWPLPYQALSNKTRKWPFQHKAVDWPSYGLATPIYYASKAWRDPLWAAEEFFQQTEKHSPFNDHQAFHKLVKEVVSAVNGSQVESYSEWPFLNYTLPMMVKSMVKRDKGICPDTLYIYFRLTPCFPSDPSFAVCTQAADHASLILAAASCPYTAVVVGYSKEYSEVENIRPL